MPWPGGACRWGRDWMASQTKNIVVRFARGPAAKPVDSRCSGRKRASPEYKSTLQKQITGEQIS
jgi:hypothetical protein